MIRSLRQAHRWLLPALLLLLVIAAVLALSYPRSLAHVEVLPAAIRATTAARP
jgi:hypothetical protein